MLTAGTGLGDLLLGQTTLDWFVRHIGKGSVSLAISDESAFELASHDEQIAFQFLINGPCAKEIGVSGDMRSATKDLEAYMARHPGCRDLTLSSISVAKGSGLNSTFLKGATREWVKLRSPIVTAFRHGRIRNRTVRMVAGLSPTNPEDVIEYRGISFCYERGASGRREDTAVTRITIFSADQ